MTDLSAVPKPYPSNLHTREQMRAYCRAPTAPRWSLATLRAAWWAWWAVRRVSTNLAARGVQAVVPPPPAVPAGARRGVDAVLRRASPTCLERSVVYQAWLAAQGVPCEVVVGVAGSGANVRAHAWLDVESSDAMAATYHEIYRILPR